MQYFKNFPLRNDNFYSEPFIAFTNTLHIYYVGRLRFAIVVSISVSEIFKCSIVLLYLFAVTWYFQILFWSWSNNKCAVTMMKKIIQKTKYSKACLTMQIHIHILCLIALDKHALLGIIQSTGMFRAELYFNSHRVIYFVSLLNCLKYILL